MKKPEMITIVIATAIAVMTVIACSKKQTTQDVPLPPTNGTLLFKSGFETGGSSNTNPTRVVKRFDANGNEIINQPDVVGSEGSGSGPTDWVYDLEQKIPSKLRFAFINYERGTPAQRFADIIDDPTKPGNKVMRYQINEPNVTLYNTNGSVKQVKARIQQEINAALTAPTKFTKYYQRIKFYLPAYNWNTTIPSIYPSVAGGNWLSLGEFRNKLPNSTGDEIAFRIVLYVTKKTMNSPGGGLYFQAHGDDGPNWTNRWNNMNTSYVIPFGKWIETELFLQEGKGTAGRFYFAVKAEGEANWTTIFDIYSQTVHSTNSTPSGFTNFSPMKAYCSDKTLNVFKNAGKSLTVLWDDLEIWENRIP
jgi:hypothetical protein